ncbi:hypothetical protein PI27_gp001 [Listeria phage WIL-1]|nr:hypothetical protein PI27_gp001 [Listeria phage WIL-1]
MIVTHLRYLNIFRKFILLSYLILSTSYIIF